MSQACNGNVGKYSPLIKVRQLEIAGAVPVTYLLIFNASFVEAT